MGEEKEAIWEWAKRPPGGRLRFQKPNDLEAAERCLWDEKTAVVGQLIDGKQLKRILGQEGNVVGDAAFHDFAILKCDSDPEIGVNGERVEEAHILLSGAAGKRVDEENGLGIFQVKSDGRAAALRFDRHAGRQISGDCAGILETLSEW